MNPFDILGLVGGGVNLLGNLFGGREVMPQQINPLTDQYYQDVLNELANWNRQQQMQTANAESAFRQVGRQAGVAEDIRDRQGMVDAPGANDWFDDMVAEAFPAYREEAAAVAEMATRGGMEAQRERAEQMSREAARTAAGQMAGSGGMYSGATGRAIGEGAANPIAQYEAQLGDQYQNAFMGAYTPLSTQGQSLAYQGQQDAFQNAMNQLGQMLGATQAAAGMYGTQGQGALNLANLFGSRAQGAERSRHDVAQPFYATPNMAPNAFSQFGSDLSNFGMFGSNLTGNPTGSKGTKGTSPNRGPSGFGGNDWMNQGMGNPYAYTP